MKSASPEPGAYLIHAERPIRHAQHYLGAAPDIPARIAAHRAGRGAALVRAFNERGIGWHVARTWPTATPELAVGTEIALKNRRDSPRICPECTPGTTRAANPAPASRRTGPVHPPVRKAEAAAGPADVPWPAGEQPAAEGEAGLTAQAEAAAAADARAMPWPPETEQPEPEGEWEAEAG